MRSAAADAELPDRGAHHAGVCARGCAKIRVANSAPAVRTAPARTTGGCALEFPPTQLGYGESCALGEGASPQTTLAQVPYEIVLDRVYVHGDPLYGQKRGIALNARTVTIRNSYISDIKAVGADAQAIGGWNGPGPFTIENNYLEASGEKIPARRQPTRRSRIW